jgi:peptidoglycan/xylan/chitin deacetylase (PgdA/CDA1 family)
MLRHLFHTNLPAENTEHMSPFARYLNWEPSPFVKAFMLMLAGAVALVAWRPALWPWAAGVIGINHIISTIAGLWPRSSLLGPNLLSLPAAAAQRGEVAITIDDGPDPEVTPQVLDILDRHNAKATFFCIGEIAERHPALCREIIRRGHTIENHSQHHNNLFSLFGPRKIYREILHAQGVLATITGYTPRFFRPSAGLRNVFLDPVLASLGLQLVTWCKRGFDTRETDPGSVLKRLLRNLKGGDILLLHDGNAAKTQAGTPVILEVLPSLLEHMAQAGLRSVSLDSALR